MNKKSATGNRQAKEKKNIILRPQKSRRIGFKSKGMAHNTITKKKKKKVKRDSPNGSQE